MAIVVQPNPRKTRTFRHLGQVEIAALKDAVLAIPEEQWNAENADKPNRFEALDVTRHIVFRFVANYRDWRDSYDRPLWAEWKHLLEPVMQSATADYGYARGMYPRVMLARMAAGGVIQPHRDANPAAKWPHKIHVPIVTNDQVIFRVEGAQYVMPEGEAVEVNNMGVHAVENGGQTDRIHLIFEYYDADQPDPDWLGPVLAAAG
jgi:hypothetical protein